MLPSLCTHTGAHIQGSGQVEEEGSGRADRHTHVVDMHTVCALGKGVAHRKKHIEREWIEKNDAELGDQFHVIDNVYFPVDFRVDENNVLRISE